jgi:hypothetical protein
MQEPRRRRVAADAAMLDADGETLERVVDGLLGKLVVA